MNHLINNSLNNNGIYRGQLIDDDGLIRAYVPGLFNINPFDDNNVLKKDINLKIFPVIQWCCYNIESMDLQNIQNPVFIMFENGNSNKPVCVSYAVIGNNSESNTQTDDDDDVSDNKTPSYTDNKNPSYTDDRTPIDTSCTGVFVDNDNIDWSDGYVILNYLLDNGYTLAGACALLGNFWVESYSWNGANKRFDPKADNGLGYKGLAQWGGSRLSELQQRANWDTLSVQLDFVLYELTTQRAYSSTNEILQNENYNNINTSEFGNGSYNNVQYLALYVCRYYEVAVTKTPGQYNGDVYMDNWYLQGGNERANWALTFYNRIKNQQGE